MSARRGSRQRRKPTPIYQVEDARDNDEEVFDEAEERVVPIANQNDEESSDDGPEDEDEEFTPAGTKVKTPRSSRRVTRTRTPISVAKLARLKRSPWSQTRSLRSAGRVKKDRIDTVVAGKAAEDSDVRGVDEDSLFDAIKGGKASLEKLLIEWRNRLEKDYEKAMKELLNVVVQACGGRGQYVPDSESLDQLNMSGLVDHVMEDLEIGNGEYPLVSRGKDMRKFQHNYEVFWEVFVNECYESEILFTSEVANALIDWLTTLSSSELRPIRHTTTFAVLSLSNSLVRTASKISEQLSIAKRQLNAEIKSPASSPGAGKSLNVRKLSLLKDNKALYENRLEQVLKLVNSIFTGVVVRRYRDVMPEIRVVTIQCLGHWITTFPDQFLKDNFLKYLGWLLSDKSALVRLEVVEILCELYENDASTNKLTLFTARFLARYLELCNDVDDAVVEQCIHLLIAVDKHSLISSDVELHSVEKLVFDTEHEAIRKAAAEFVCLQYDAFGVAVSNTKNKKLKREQLNTQAIALVEFAEEYIRNHGIPERAVETLVDAFWGLEDCLVLQDWRLLTDLLLVDKSAPDLSSDQQTILLRVLVASVRMLVGIAKSSFASKKDLENLREEITVAYCKDIPSMLLLYQADPDKLTLILELIPMLTLKSEVIGHHSCHVKELLEKLKHAYLLHSNEELLTNLSLAITHLLQTEHSSSKREAEVIVRELIQEIMSKSDRYLKADVMLFNDFSDSAGSTPKTNSTKTKKRKIKRSQIKEVSDVQYGLQSALCRIKCLVKHLDIREFLLLDLPSPRANEDDHNTAPNSPQGQMQEFVTALRYLLRRRTTSALGLDEMFRHVDTIKHGLTIIYFDLLWTTAPIFKAIEEDNKRNSSSNAIGEVDVDISIQTQIQQICQLRSTLEEALVSILRMHLARTKEVTDEELKHSEENCDPQILEDENVIAYVREVQRFAFLTLCDVRCLFVEKFQETTAPFDALEWKLPKALVLLTQMHFESEMDDAEEDEPEFENDSEDCDPEIAREKADAISEWQEKQRRKAEMLVALGRVALCNPSKKHQAAAVLQYFTSSGKPSVEVVKAFGKHVKSDAPVRFLEIQMTALRRMYASILIWKQDIEAAQGSEVKDGDEVLDQEELIEKLRSSEQELKELAKRFSQSLGIGKISSSLRTPFLRFLREGVRYALDKQEHFEFLDIMRVYLSHLDSFSMGQLREYFTERLKGLRDVPAESAELDSRWRALFDFQASIISTHEKKRCATNLIFSPPLRSKRRSASSEPTPMQRTSIAEDAEDENAESEKEGADVDDEIAARKNDGAEIDGVAGDHNGANPVEDGNHVDQMRSLLQKRAATTEFTSINSLPPPKRMRLSRDTGDANSSESDEV